MTTPTVLPTEPKYTRCACGRLELTKAMKQLYGPGNRCLKCILGFDLPETLAKKLNTHASSVRQTR